MDMAKYLSLLLLFCLIFNLNPNKVTAELPLILEMFLNVSIFTELNKNKIRY